MKKPEMKNPRRRPEKKKPKANEKEREIGEVEK